jgi:7,8-dihydropterin-6-yl-methyl-4-(beta-D-ribofuranosyl)aminobenzene 5'-phosphate synthase
MEFYADNLPEDERAQTTIPNQFCDEIATAFNIEGRGLVVLTSCSHRGVIKAIKEAQATSGINKVQAVVGGAPSQDYVRDSAPTVP